MRCFWHGGALDALKQACTIEPERVAASSGGALSAACFISGRGKQLIDCFAARLEDHERNVRPSAALDDRRLTPHQRIYRAVVADVLDEEAQRAVADGPQLEILLAVPPQWLPIRPASALTMILYEIDKRLRSTPHGRLAQSAGARELRVDGRQAAREGRLVELVCKAATIPPVFEIKQWDDVPIIDAGTLDNAPMPTGGRGATLVLLTRSYRNLPQVEDRTYLFPSRATQASKIDFTDAEAIRSTYAQGLRDVSALLERLGR